MAINVYNTILTLNSKQVNSITGISQMKIKPKSGKIFQFKILSRTNLYYKFY